MFPPTREKNGFCLSVARKLEFESCEGTERTNASRDVNIERKAVKRLRGGVVRFRGCE